MTVSADGVDGRTQRADAKRMRRRAELIETSLEVFGRKGYHQTHVSDLIEAANVARGTFYLYFDSKSALFLELLDQLLAELRGSIQGVDTSAGAPPFEEQLMTVIRRILGTIVNNRLLTKIIVREAVGLDAVVDRRLRLFYRRLLTYVEESISRGKELGLVRDLNPRIAAMCILGSIKQLMEQLVLLDGDKSAPEQSEIDGMARDVLEYNLRGLLPSDR